MKLELECAGSGRRARWRWWQHEGPLYRVLHQLICNAHSRGGISDLIIAQSIKYCVI